MARRTWLDESDLPFYELACDGCGSSFACFDDSCYDWRLLRDSAVFAGWLADPAPAGPHRCPGCLAGTHGNAATAPLPITSPSQPPTTDSAAAEDPPPEAADSPTLMLRSGSAAGRRYLLDGEKITIGRSLDSDILLDDVTVSRRHAELTRDGGAYVLADVGSLNGVWVNRKRVPAVELADGDEVQIGRYRLTYHDRSHGQRQRR